jgi:enamine deaminase RidA (YjgF/YER057c/UK114 family)
MPPANPSPAISMRRCARCSRGLGKTLEEAGGKLADMVTMTVFITDGRYGDRFTQLRREIFGDNFPASALITVTGLARPGMLVEVQGIAVID